MLDDALGDVHLGLALDHAILLSYPFSNCSASMRFWRNPKSVIIGRGQTPSEEVNLPYCLKHEITLGRRISGGGAVYQDEGNLNISWLIPRGALEKPNDIRETSLLFSNILSKSLETTGIDSISIGDHGSIFYKGRKVSGSSAYFTKDLILYHSTLLLSVDLVNLERSLKHNLGHPRRRSKYSPTINLPEFSIDDWKFNLIKIVEERFNTQFRSGNLVPEEIALAKNLRDEMYSQKSWIIRGERGTKLLIN